jgi:guanylate kinase
MGVTHSVSKAPDESRIVVLSGPSGSGKTTVVNRLLREAPVRLMKAVSATTRPPRQGEAHGEDYYFLSPEEFETKRQNGEFLECAEVHAAGYWYGTLRSELERARCTGAWALLEIDVQGAMRVVEEYPQAVTIFLTTPSLDEYEHRLRARGTESEEVIRRRLETARRELQSAVRYRHRVMNDDLDRAVRAISDILSNREAELNA